MGLGPLQPSAGAPPLAVQVVEFAAVQVIVLDPPGRMWVGWALKVMLGGAGGAELSTLRIRLSEPVPPGPEQVIEYAYSPATAIAPVLNPTAF